MPATIAMTGATGFIGSAVAAALLERGDKVVVLTRKDSVMTRLARFGGYEALAYRDLSDPDLAAELRGRGTDIFIHCAWRGVGGQDRNEEYQMSENVPVSLASARLAAEAGCRQWIGLGSQAEYGNQNRRMAEDAPELPTTAYGRAKLAAGRQCLAFCGESGVAGAWLRVFSTYGPQDAPNWFIPYVVRELLEGRPPKLTGCEQLWDYLFVADAARAVAAVADGHTQGVFNLGSGEARPLREFIEIIREEIGDAPEPVYGAVPYRPDQVMHLEADISRLSAATGWQPRTPMRDGIRATIAFERTRSA
jgi:nucleoside-diphosphate-sugar epimerase